MTFGISADGFTPKPFETIVSELRQDLRAAFGAGFATGQNSRAGILIDNIALQLADLWLEQQQAYDMQDPDNAEGIFVDSLLELASLTRQPATATAGSVTLLTAISKTITAGRTIAYQTNEFTLDANVDSTTAMTAKSCSIAEVFPAGVIDLVVDGDAYSRTILDVDTESTILQNLANQVNAAAAGQFAFIEDDELWIVNVAPAGAAPVVTLAGQIDYAIAGGSTDGLGEGFVWVANDVTAAFTTGIAFDIVGGPNAGSYNVASPGASFDGLKTVIPVGAVAITNSVVGTLERALSVAVGSEAIFGGTGTVTATATGALAGPQLAVTSIVTPVADWLQVFNAETLTIGRAVESDFDALSRRLDSLNNQGSGNIDAIRAAVRNVTGVTRAQTYQNTSLVTDGFGQPAKSVWVVALGGADQDIAEAIFSKLAAGIESYGTEGPFAVIDSQGDTQYIDFTRPTTVSIYLEYLVVLDAEQGDFPADGEDQIKALAQTFGDAHFQIGQDVAPWKLIGAISSVDGMGDVQLRLKAGSAPAPGDVGPIAIARDEQADFDIANIVVTVS